jgi:hypothetical protein
VDSFAHTFSIPFRAEKSDLIRQARDVGGQCEQLIGKRLGEMVEARIVAVLRVIGPAHIGGLGLQRVQTVERHGGVWYSQRMNVDHETGTELSEMEMRLHKVLPSLGLQDNSSHDVSAALKPK